MKASKQCPKCQSIDIGYIERMYEFCEARELPQAWLMSGGYGPEVWRVHAQFLVWALRRRLGP